MVETRIEILWVSAVHGKTTISFPKGATLVGAVSRGTMIGLACRLDIEPTAFIEYYDWDVVITCWSRSHKMWKHTRYIGTVEVSGDFYSVFDVGCHTDDF